MGNQFLNYLENLDFNTLVSLWNEYIVDDLPEYYIWDNIEAYIESEDVNAVDIAHMVYFGRVSSWEDKVYLDGSGNFVSCLSLESSPIDLEELTKWLEEMQHKVIQIKKHLRDVNVFNN